MVKLNKEQIQRLYNVFDFDENEEIVSSVMVNGQLEITYLDKDGVVGVYKPYFDGEEDNEKFDFIINGIKLERDI